MSSAKSTELSIQIEGMTCDHCATSVDAAIVAVRGVQASHTAYATGRAVVLTNADTDANAIRAAVERKGYRVTKLDVISAVDSGADARATRSGGEDALDLLIVGGGSAAFAAAIRASELGASVAIVERGALGGTCVNVGCVPSKALIRAAEAYERARHHSFAGVETKAGTLDFAKVIAEKRALVGSLRQSKYWDVLASYPSIRLIEGNARMRPDGSVEVDGRPVAARKILLAMGARPWTPPIPGLDATPHLDSTSLMELDELPRRMVVIGAGAVGLELAQAFARFGSEVTVMVLPRVLAREDEAVSAEIEKQLKREGIDFVTAAAIRGVSGDERVVRVEFEGVTGTRTITADGLLVAAGRRANSAGMGLAEAGIALGKRGEVIVDAHLRTKLAHVFAAGDVIGDPAFVYVAAYAGRLAAENALGDTPTAYDVSLVPRVTFTDPAVASIGLTEVQARASGVDVQVSMLPMSYVPRAIAARDTRGFVKLVADARTKLLIGAHIVAPEAGDMIEEILIAMRFGITYPQLASLMHPYLTNSEAIKLAWPTVGKIIERVVTRKLGDASGLLDGLTRIGIDELSFRKNHEYVTIIVDHDRERVVWVGEGKSSETLARFFEALGKERSAKLVLVSMDMSQAYKSAVAEHAPQAEIVFDRFHVQRLAHDALDEVRRSIMRELKGTPEAKDIKGTRFALQRSDVNLTPKDETKLATVMATNAPLFRAWMLKTVLAAILDETDVTRARERLEGWMAWAARSQLKPFARVARSIRVHLEGILAYVRTGISNGRSEGLNGKTRVITRRAYGFHSATSLIALLFLCCSGLVLTPRHA